MKIITDKMNKLLSMQRNIFFSERDYLKWSKQKEYINHSENIDDNTREKALVALAFLEQEFGAHFFKTTSINHPVRQMISNKTEYQIKDLFEFVNTLKILKAANSNYQKLLQKLLSAKTAKTEGIPFVEIAGKYIKEKLNISFIEEDNNQGNKTPDVQVSDTDSGDVFYIEITTLNNSDERNLIRKNYDFFHAEFNYIQPLFSFYGKQKQIIVEEEYPAIQQIIVNTKNKVKDNNQIIYYSDKRFCFLLAPESHAKNFNEICEKNNIRAIHFSGLPHDYDETSRINNKISKAKQIPEDSNGLLYIAISPLYFMTTDLSGAIERLATNISKYKNLLGIVLLSKIVDSREEMAVKFGNHFFARKTVENLCYETLFIYNENCNLTLSEETIQKIYRSMT